MSNPMIPNGQIRIVDMNGSSSGILPATLINSYSSLTIPAFKRAVAFLADNLAAFPRSVRKDGAKLETPHPLAALLRNRPNATQNGTTFWRTLFGHAVHMGNGYARIYRDGASQRPRELHNLLPEDVMPFRWVDEQERVSQWYLHRPGKAVLPAADVIHLQGLSYDGMTGLNPVELHENTLQRAATIERYQVQFLRKGTIVRGAVEIPHSLTKEQRDEIKAVLRTFRGAEADDDVLVLSDGAKLTNVTTTPAQSQLVEQTAQLTKQIAQAMGVPPVFLYELSEEKYRQSVEQDGQNVVRFTFRPWIHLIQDELTVKLLSIREQDEGYTIALNPNALLRGDTQTQTTTIVAKVNAGIMTRNEARELLEMSPSDDPDADKLKTLGDTSPQPASTPDASRET